MGLMFDSYALDVLIILLTLIYIIYAYCSSTYSYWKDRGIPYKKPTLFFGEMKDQLLGRKGFTDIHLDIYKEMPNVNAVGYFEFRQPKLMICNPDLAEKVLIKDFVCFHDRGLPYDVEIEPLSGHLFHVEGLYWRNLRYKLTPAFTTGKLRSMFSQMCNCAENIVKYIVIQSKVGNDCSFEGKELIKIFSIDVIASCAFGLEFSNESEQGRLFRKMIKEAFSPTIGAVVRNLIMTTFPKLAKILKITSLPSHLNEYFMNITKETIQFRRSSNIKRNDFLQMILSLQEQEQNNKIVMDNKHDDTIGDALLNQLENDPILDNNESTTKIFTDDCLAAQCFVFLGAGSDSVAIVTSYCLYALATNVHVQEKLQKEVDTVLEKHNRKWTFEAVKEMKYLDQVLSETHRMYPALGFLVRKCTKPFQVPDSNYIVEPNTDIVIPMYCFQHDEKYFPNPYTFDPERFAEGKMIHKGTFLPFGDGPRICIGLRFAQLEIKVCIAHIVSAFSVRVSKKTIQPFQYEPLKIFIEPKGGLWFHFDKRVTS